MSDIVATAAYLIRDMGVKIKSGPYYNRRRSTRDGVEDVHLFRVRTILSKKQAAGLGLEYPEKTNWSQERSLRFRGTFDTAGTLLVSLKPIGSSCRKKLGKGVTKKSRLYRRKKRTTQITQKGETDTRKMERAGPNKGERRIHAVRRRHSRKHTGD